MKKGHDWEDDRKEPESRPLFGGFGARIVRSLFFWGLAAVLASSAYTGIVRIAGSREQPGREAADATAGTAREAAIPTAGRSVTAETVPEQDLQVTAAEETTGQEQQAAGEEPTEDPAERKLVALTFDDGPHPLYTEELLDGLKERGAKATFFVVGKNIPGNEDLIRRMADEGHLIGNHTYDHVKISNMNKEDACRQIEKTSRLVRELTGSDTEFVRPPFGEWNRELEGSFVMIPVLWDVDPRDWTTRNVSDIVRRVLQDTENGDIILLHDYYKSSVQAALKIVDALQEEGYEFVTVDELILE